MPTDKKLNQLIINKLTAEQYAGIESPDPEQLYFVPDETEESLPPQAPEDKGKALLANGDGTASWKGVANAESANDWKEPQTFSGGAVADEIKSKSTGNSVLKTQKNTSGAWTLSVGSSARPTKVEGTEVDLAGALKANNNGDVEVFKNLKVDGMATFGGGKNTIYQKTKIENFDGTEISSTMGFLLLSGVGQSTGGQTVSNGPACLFLLNEEGAADGATAKIGVPRNASGEIITSIASDDFSPYATFGLARRFVIANEDDQLQENVIYVDNLTSKSAVPAIDSKFCLSDNPTVSLAKLATASQAKYQHTVTIKGTRPAQGGGACFLTFTAYSPKNTPIDSAQDLIGVFGGCDLSVSGMYSPAQGTNFGAIRLMIGSASTIDDVSLAYIDPGIINEAGVKMSECGNLSFEDDVFPK